MPFSAYLDGKRAACRALVDALSDAYPYVSVLGTDVQETNYLVDRRSSSARDGEGECGFVVRLHDGGAFYEYAFDVPDDPAALAARIKASTKTDPSLAARAIRCPVPEDPPHREDFVRESDFAAYDDAAVLSFCTDLRDKLLQKD